MEQSKKFADKKKKIQANKRKVFLENPYDLETFFESLSIASDNGKELIFIDRFIATVRLDPEGEVSDILYKILSDLELMKT